MTHNGHDEIQKRSTIATHDKQWQWQKLNMANNNNTCKTMTNDKYANQPTNNNSTWQTMRNYKTCKTAINNTTWQTMTKRQTCKQDKR